jgi:hypothetical protein
MEKKKERKKERQKQKLSGRKLNFIEFAKKYSY